MKRPTISIVTPSYNQGQFLEQTIVSVLEQNYPYLEYIIIDGGSLDGSVEIIKKYEKRLVYWQSAKDGGQTDALIQGFSRATGEIMNWLNSDDLLAAGALQHVAELAESNPSASIYAAATEEFVEGAFESGRKKIIPQNLDIESFFYMSGRRPHRHQPGLFFRRDLYEAIDGFSRNYHICMDFDLHLRLLVHCPEVAYSEKTIAYFRLHKESKTQGREVRNTLLAVKEYMEICEQVGRRIGIRPNHKAAHLKTLCSVLLNSILRGQLNVATQSFKLASQIAGPLEISGQILSMTAKRMKRI